MDDVYTRDLFVEDLEVRDGRSGEPTRLVGYAAVFNQDTVIHSREGDWIERILPTAFNDVLGDDVIAAVNHDPKMVLGRSRRGTLRLSTDEKGLRYEVTLPNTSLARDTVENVRNGNYAGSSFTFSVRRDDLHVTRGADLPHVAVGRVKSLIDVGPVTFPAYESASVAARGLGAMIADAVRGAVDDREIQRRELVRLRIALERAKAWA